jgi:hypothetical protein
MIDDYDYVYDITYINSLKIGMSFAILPRQNGGTKKGLM